MLGDRDQLRQVVTNLVQNALVHTPTGTPIEVTVEHDRDVVRLGVRDHGTGLEPGAYGAMALAAFRGRQAEASPLIEASAGEALLHGEGNRLAAAARASVAASDGEVVNSSARPSEFAARTLRWMSVRPA